MIQVVESKTLSCLVVKNVSLAIVDVPQSHVLQFALHSSFLGSNCRSVQTMCDFFADTERSDDTAKMIRNVSIMRKLRPGI